MDGEIEDPVYRETVWSRTGDAAGRGELRRLGPGGRMPPPAQRTRLDAHLLVARWLWLLIFRGLSSGRSLIGFGLQKT